MGFGMESGVRCGIGISLWARFRLGLGEGRMWCFLILSSILRVCQSSFYVLF